MADNRRIISVPTQQQIARFWSHIDKSGGPLACWPWTGTRLQNGYGWSRFLGKTRPAHRVVCFLSIGYWPQVARHSCDNPPCCNPAHILPGTYTDNSADMIARGRSATGARNGTHTHPESRARGKRNGAHKYPERLPCGENNILAKFPDALIEAARNSEGLQREIARRFGMSQQHVSRIKLGQTRRRPTP